MKEERGGGRQMNQGTDVKNDGITAEVATEEQDRLIEGVFVLVCVSKRRDDSIKDVRTHETYSGWETRRGRMSRGHRCACKSEQDRHTTGVLALGKGTAAHRQARLPALPEPRCSCSEGRGGDFRKGGVSVGPRNRHRAAVTF
jgi:hypothetical protein